MEGSRYTEERLSFALRQAESDVSAAEGGNTGMSYAWMVTQVRNVRRQLDSDGCGL